MQITNLVPLLIFNCKGDLKINHPVTKKLRLKITKEKFVTPGQESRIC